MSALLPHKLLICKPKLERSMELFWWRKILAGPSEVSKHCTKENGEVSVRQTERGGGSQILTTICSKLSGIWSSSSGHKQCSVLNQPRTVRIIKDCGDKWHTDLYRSLHSGIYWQWTKSSIHQNLFHVNVASSVYSFTVILNNFKFQIFALLVCYGAQIGTHRRFGTAYRSHLQGSSTTYPLTMESMRCPKMSVTTILHYVTSQKSEDFIYTAVEAWNHNTRGLCLCTYVHYSATIGTLF